MTVPVLVPWRTDEGILERVWMGVQNAQWRDPRFIIFEGDSDPNKLLSRPAAINAAAQAAGDWDVAIIADPDILVSPAKLATALDWVTRSKRAMVPFTERVRLSQEATRETLLSGGIQEPVETISWTPAALGPVGLVVVHREVWDAVGGYDTSLAGGYEDRAFLQAAMLMGSYKRLPGTAWQMWHLRPEPVVTREMAARFNNPYMTALTFRELKKELKS